MPKLFTPNSGDLGRMVGAAMSKFDKSRSIHQQYPNLQRYVASKNIWAKFDPCGKMYDLSHFTAADKSALMEDLECDLSPENLCCDGELSGQALRQKAQHLNAVKAELKAFVCL